MLSINKMDYSKLDVNTRCTVQVNYGAVGTLLAYRPSIPRYFTQWRINHDANDAMAWGPPLKGAPRAAV